METGPMFQVLTKTQEIGNPESHLQLWFVRIVALSLYTEASFLIQ